MPRSMVSGSYDKYMFIFLKSLSDSSGVTVISVNNAKRDSVFLHLCLDL